MATDTLAPEMTIWAGKTKKRTWALVRNSATVDMSDTAVVKEVRFVIVEDLDDTTAIYSASSLGASPHITFSGTSALLTMPPATTAALTAGKRYWYDLEVEYVDGYIPPHPPGKVNVVEQGV